MKGSEVALTWGHGLTCGAYLLMRSALTELSNWGRGGRENYQRFIPGAYGTSKGRCPVGSWIYTSEALVGGLGWSCGQEGASRPGQPSSHEHGQTHAERRCGESTVPSVNQSRVSNELHHSSAFFFCILSPGLISLFALAAILKDDWFSGHRAHLVCAYNFKVLHHPKHLARYG